MKLKDQIREKILMHAKAGSYNPSTISMNSYTLVLLRQECDGILDASMPTRQTEIYQGMKILIKDVLRDNIILLGGPWDREGDLK